MENNNDTKKPDGQVPDTKKRPGFIWTLLYILVGAVFLTGVYLILREYVLFPAPYVAPPTPAPTATIAPTLPPQVTPVPTPSPTPYVKKIPVRIYFTDHELQADIYPVGVTENNEMATLDSAKDAAWYQFGPSPGEEGNAIINGHVRWKGEKGTFSILKEMSVGEEIVIEFDDGGFKYFTVDTLDTYLLDEVPASVMDLKGESRMTLITCLGDYDRDLGTSRSRVVAVCREKTE